MGKTRAEWIEYANQLRRCVDALRRKCQRQDEMIARLKAQAAEPRQMELELKA